MYHRQIRFLFLNVGHFLDHLFMLIFASVAALRLSAEWGMSYAELVPYATAGFVAFGGFAILAGTTKLATNMKTASSPNILGYLVFIVPPNFSRTPKISIVGDL